jgi:hypothetical protein
MNYKLHFKTKTSLMTWTNYFSLPAVEAVFDFALQLTGSMGNVRAELERHPLPGLATAFKPAVPGRGLLSLVELSVKTLGHRKGQEQQQPVEIPAPVPVLAEDQVQMSPQISVKSRPLLVNAHSSSMDSGFNDDEINSRSSSPGYSRQLSKTNSGCSLPYTSEQKSRAILSKWKSFTRSQTEPELKHQTLSITGRRTSLRQLLMEAVLILEEAEVKETALNNQSDE